MPIYLYECRECGEYETEQSIHEPPLQTCIVDGCNEPVRRLISQVAICIPKEHKAVTYAGREGERVNRRHFRENKAVAEGLANGTMMPPADRDVAGDKQTRESIAQLNSMYESAKASPQPKK